MATLHQATLEPSKLGLIAGWIGDRPWFAAAGGRPEDLEVVGAYRFDDPDGRVGVEVHLVRGPGGGVLQVPVTYRDAPLPVAADRLMGTAEHSVLGRRWCYDGCADPVLVGTMTAAILGGGSEAGVEVLTPDGPVRREPTVRVEGRPAPSRGPLATVDDGSQTIVATGAHRLVVERILDPAGSVPADVAVLVGTWPDQDRPVLLASIKAG